MIATKTISQGDTRENGLAQIVKSEGVIVFAHRFIKWPGDATVEVNLLAIKRGNVQGDCELDGKPVKMISSHLEAEAEIQPRKIVANSHKAIRGTNPRGAGFILDVNEANNLLEANPKNAECILPFLTGDDLNSDPRQCPSRKIINFFNWPLERANNYPELISICRTKVKPQREQLGDLPGYRRLKDNWWQFEYHAEELYEAFKKLDFAFCRSRVSELHMVAKVPKGWVYGEATVTFVFDDYYHFAAIQSSIHEMWVRKNASTLRTDIRYTPTDCFETFPFPQQPSPKDRTLAERAGEEYHEHRLQVMLNRNLGLTKTYNLFHDPACKEQDIQYLRELHIKMDKAIIACYGWVDLDLNHSFYQNDRGHTRFTISRDARHEVLQRLLTLNLRITAGEKGSE